MPVDYNQVMNKASQQIGKASFALFLKLLGANAFSQFAFSLGVERDGSPKSILKNIYFLMEHPDFVNYTDLGFTLVLRDHEELSDEINAILKPVI